MLQISLPCWQKCCPLLCQGQSISGVLEGDRRASAAVLPPLGPAAWQGHIEWGPLFKRGHGPCCVVQICPQPLPAPQHPAELSAPTDSRRASVCSSISTSPHLPWALLQKSKQGLQSTAEGCCQS